tara:strand:+ start:460 stop:618 length:159 start_codon:yes stop_codon:yes gene_type:complete
MIQGLKESKGFSRQRPNSEIALLASSRALKSKAKKYRNNTYSIKTWYFFKNK